MHLGITLIFAFLALFHVDALPESDSVGKIGEDAFLNHSMINEDLANADRDPGFEKDYEYVAAHEGSKLEILCSATGEPPLTYMWYDEFEEQIPITPDSPIFVSRSENGSALNIKAVNITDGGVYTCSASNSFGLASKLFQLTVFPIPVQDPPRNLEIKSVTDTSISLLWDAPAQSTEEFLFYRVLCTGNTTYQEYTTKSTFLSITNLYPYTWYTIKVKVQGKNSSSEWTDEKIVRTSVGVPFTPRDFRVISVTNDSIYFNWKEPEPSTGPILHYTVMYADKIVGKKERDTPDTYIVLLNLRPFTDYRVKVRAHTEAGSGMWTAEQTIRTKADPCATNPCQNGGSCFIVGDSFECLCKDSFSGRRCENVGDIPDKNLKVPLLVILLFSGLFVLLFFLGCCMCWSNLQLRKMTQKGRTV